MLRRQRPAPPTRPAPHPPAMRPRHLQPQLALLRAPGGRRRPKLPSAADATRREPISAGLGRSWLGARPPPAPGSPGAEACEAAAAGEASGVSSRPDPLCPAEGGVPETRCPGHPRGDLVTQAGRRAGLSAWVGLPQAGAGVDALPLIRPTTELARSFRAELSRASALLPAQGEPAGPPQASCAASGPSVAAVLV